MADATVAIAARERRGARRHPERADRRRRGRVGQEAAVALAGAAAHKEFFAVRTVAEALAGFRPARRTAVEIVALAQAHGRVPAQPVDAPHDLPGFARSTVDGYAVRASDTRRRVRAGTQSPRGDRRGLRPAARAAPRSRAGERRSPMPTGGAIPAGADAVVMVEQTERRRRPGTIEASGRRRRGQHVSARADDDAVEGIDAPPRRPRAARARPRAPGSAAGVT